MEREIIELRKQVAAQQADSNHSTGIKNNYINPAQIGPGATAHEAVAGLLDLRNDNSPGGRGIFKRLEDVTLTKDRIDDLFKRFFTLHHPYLPFLNPDKSPDDYFQRSPLLFWAIVFVGARHYSVEPQLFSAMSQPLHRLVWSTLAEVPQNYHVVKALILLCAWPFPTSSTSSDPTFMLCGMMMQIAMQIGLHRPTHAQDFSKFRIELREAELQDRIVVWSVCNIVAQRIATAYGQPALTHYDWTLGSHPIEGNPNYQLPEPIRNRLLIEEFCDKVSRTLYGNADDPVGLVGDQERSTYVRFLSKDLEDLQNKLRDDPSPITKVYLRAGALHLHLSAFFAPPNTPTYRFDLLKLQQATTDFLEACLSFEYETEIAAASGYSHHLSLQHSTNYIFFMMLAAGFSMLKLMHNFLTKHDLDTQGPQELLTRTLWTLRSQSVVDNDLPERLSEVLAQVWKSERIKAHENEANSVLDSDTDDSLQLKVRCRLSMSLVFDSVWRWRQNFQFKGAKPLEGMEAFAISDIHTGLPSRLCHTKVPPILTPNETGSYTNPATFITREPTPANGTSNANNTTALPSLGTDTSNPNALSEVVVPGMAGMSSGLLDDTHLGGMMQSDNPASYEVFDPLHWMLDGMVSFPYDFTNGGEILGGMAGNVGTGGGVGVSGLSDSGL